MQEQQDQQVVAQEDGSVVMQYGPLHLVVKAFVGERCDTALAAQSSSCAFSCLERLAVEYTQLKTPHGRIHSDPWSDVGIRMLASVRLIGDADLTPMAAVAGTIADAVAEWLRNAGADRIIVNNGGDIAIRLSPEEAEKPLRVGLRPRVDSSQISHTIELLPGRMFWGINTSGLGGRSLTRGIASAVTAFARSSSIADAAATAIANACNVDDPAIVRVPAMSLDPNSDLGEIPVTVSVSGLSEHSAQRALRNGFYRAESLVDLGHIYGAMLVVGTSSCVTSDFSNRVGTLETI